MKFLVLGKIDQLLEKKLLDPKLMKNLSYIELTGDQISKSSNLLDFENHRLVDLVDFHTMTVEIIDIAPDVILYVSPFLFTNVNTIDLLEIAHEELILHLCQSAEVFRATLILMITSPIQPNIGSEPLFYSLHNGEKILNQFKDTMTIILELDENGSLLPSNQKELLPWVKNQLNNNLTGSLKYSK